MCTKPESNAKEKIDGVKTDNLLGNFVRNTKKTIVEIETEIKKICMFVRREELSESPCPEATGIARIKIVNGKKYLIALFIIQITLACFATLESPLSFIKTNASTTA
tara:strand:- start:280 stop:600 length:321 start_codon:yes stop_codon:yes gene_type:complete